MTAADPSQAARGPSYPNAANKASATAPLSDADTSQQQPSAEMAEGVIAEDGVTRGGGADTLPNSSVTTPLAASGITSPACDAIAVAATASPAKTSVPAEAAGSAAAGNGTGSGADAVQVVSSGAIAASVEYLPGMHPVISPDSGAGIAAVGLDSERVGASSGGRLGAASSPAQQVPARGKQQQSKGATPPGSKQQRKGALQKRGKEGDKQEEPLLGVNGGFGQQQFIDLICAAVNTANQGIRAEISTKIDDLAVKLQQGQAEMKGELDVLKQEVKETKQEVRDLKQKVEAQSELLDKQQVQLDAWQGKQEQLAQEVGQQTQLLTEQQVQLDDMQGKQQEQAKELKEDLGKQQEEKLAELREELAAKQQEGHGHLTKDLMNQQKQQLKGLKEGVLSKQQQHLENVKMEQQQHLENLKVEQQQHLENLKVEQQQHLEDFKEEQQQLFSDLVEQLAAHQEVALENLEELASANQQQLDEKFAEHLDELDELHEDGVDAMEDILHQHKHQQYSQLKGALSKIEVSLTAASEEQQQQQEQHTAALLQAAKRLRRPPPGRSAMKRNGDAAAAPGAGDSGDERGPGMPSGVAYHDAAAGRAAAAAAAAAATALLPAEQVVLPLAQAPNMVTIAANTAWPESDGEFSKEFCKKEERGAAQGFTEFAGETGLTSAARLGNVLATAEELMVAATTTAAHVKKGLNRMQSLKNALPHQDPPAAAAFHPDGSLQQQQLEQEQLQQLDGKAAALAAAVAWAPALEASAKGEHELLREQQQLLSAVPVPAAEVLVNMDLDEEEQQELNKPGHRAVARNGIPQRQQAVSTGSVAVGSEGVDHRAFLGGYEQQGQGGGIRAGDWGLGSAGLLPPSHSAAVQQPLQSDYWVASSKDPLRIRGPGMEQSAGAAGDLRAAGQGSRSTRRTRGTGAANSTGTAGGTVATSHSSRLSRMVSAAGAGDGYASISNPFEAAAVEWGKNVKRAGYGGRPGFGQGGAAPGPVSPGKRGTGGGVAVSGTRTGARGGRGGELQGAAAASHTSVTLGAAETSYARPAGAQGGSGEGSALGRAPASLAAASQGAAREEGRVGPGPKIFMKPYGAQAKAPETQLQQRR